MVPIKVSITRLDNISIPLFVPSRLIVASALNALVYSQFWHNSSITEVVDYFLSSTQFMKRMKENFGQFCFLTSVVPVFFIKSGKKNVGETVAAC
jgi:hypothetical protein